MLRSISFISALVGVGFAAAAALLPDTGIDGTPGAFLALLASVAVTLALGLVLFFKVPATARVFAWIAALLAVLTALAAWFLMQDALLVTMIVALLALLASGPNAERKIVR